MKGQRFSELLLPHWGEASERSHGSLKRWPCMECAWSERNRGTPTLSPAGSGKQALSGIPASPGSGAGTDTR